MLEMKKEVVNQISWVPSPSLALASQKDRKVSFQLSPVHQLGHLTSLLVCGIYVLPSQLFFFKSALRQRLCDVHISVPCFTR